MRIELYELLIEHPTLVFFVVLGIGHLVGRVSFKSIPIGATAGVLVTALVFGHLGMPAPAELVKDIGFALFIYCVGVEAGPTFVSVFLAGGMRYLALALVIAGTAFGLSWFITDRFDLSPAHAAGLMAGALTSTPTLAAAQDAVKSGIAGVPEELKEAVANTISVSYAITYVFGLFGLLLMVRVLPRLRGINLRSEARSFAVEYGMIEDGGERPTSGLTPLIRSYQVPACDFTGDTLENVAFRARTGCVVHRVKRDGAVADADAATVLRPGDRITVIGPLDSHNELRTIFDRDALDADLLDVSLASADVVVSNAEIVGRPLGDIVPAESGVFITGVVRAGIQLPVNPDMPVARGDTIAIAGVAKRLEDVARRLGEEERDLDRTDLLTFTLGIAAGLFIAEIVVVMGALSIGVGMAGGLLLSGVVVGAVGSHNPSFGRIPPAARSILKELGLVVFMASVGLAAGSGIVEALASDGPLLLVAGVVVTIVPMFVGFLFGAWVLKIHPALLMGALTGAMTSTPALHVLTEEADNAVPALGYAGTYTFANVLLAVAGAMMMVFR